MEYKIIHRETLVGEFTVEADSPEAAIEEYRFLVNDGKIDFSDMDISDSSDMVYGYGKVFMSMYDYFKQMSKEEMKQFLYWVYTNGNRDGRNNQGDDESGYFGGYFLDLDFREVLAAMMDDNK